MKIKKTNLCDDAGMCTADDGKRHPFSCEFRGIGIRPFSMPCTFIEPSTGFCENEKAVLDAKAKEQT